MESRQSFLTVQERGVTYVRANPAAPYTNGEKARRLAMVTLTLMTIAAACLIVGGYGGKATNLAVKQANTAPVIHRTMRLDEEAEADAAPAEADAAPAEDGSSIPDPEEAKKKAAEALKKARYSSSMDDVIDSGNLQSLSHFTVTRIPAAQHTKIIC